MRRTTTLIMLSYLITLRLLSLHKYAFAYNLIDKIKHYESLKNGEVYICLLEEDLVELIEKLMITFIEIGKDVGIICYNEPLVKRIILDGITTISTGFSKLGSEAAECII